MPWTLEIHHIDVDQGDATLIVARKTAPAVAPIVRTVLIDGGRSQEAPYIHEYILRTAGVTKVDVIVVTHYDADHMEGITTLLTAYGGMFDETFIFDQGWPYNTFDDPYLHYLKAIDGVGRDGRFSSELDSEDLARARVTKKVVSFGGAQNFEIRWRRQWPASFPKTGTTSIPEGSPKSIIEEAYTLLGNEIMWTNSAGAPDSRLYGGGAFAPGVAGGPPQMLCIAANEWVLRHDNYPIHYPSSGSGVDKRNARSLAFMIQFGDFRYYIGGDITSLQEDRIGDYLIRQIKKEEESPIHAMKLSHHGANESSSAEFIRQLKPAAAFISCGYANSFQHPRQRVLNDLEQQASLRKYYITNDRSADDYCCRLNNGAGAAPQAYTSKAVVAGGRGANGFAAPAAPSPCGGRWPNEGLPARKRGNIVLKAAAGSSGFTVTYDKPVMQLTSPLTVSADTWWPDGELLPEGTVLPAELELHSLWFGVQGAKVDKDHTLTDIYSLPPGVMPLTPYDISNFRLPKKADLPANVMWGPFVPLPAGTIFPVGSMIPESVKPSDEGGDTVLDEPWTLPKDILWPTGIALPEKTSLPEGTIFPMGTSWPAESSMPRYDMPPGARLPRGFVFPPGAMWPKHMLMPKLVLPAGYTWERGRALCPGTILPAGSRIPPGAQFPPGTALPQGTTYPTTIKH